MTQAKFVQALALGVDPGFRRLDEATRAAAARDFLQAQTELRCQSFSYSMIGLQPGCDLMFWKLADSLEALEEDAALTLRSGVGRWLHVRESLLGVIQPSQYVRRPTSQEQSLFAGERSRYLVVYPFTKSTEWYLLGKDARQGIMNEHIRIGHDFPQVRQLLANSFGVDDMDFLVAYETDDLPNFGELVRALRASESRRSTVRDTPILVGRLRPVEQILDMIGA